MGDYSVRGRAEDLLHLAKKRGFAAGKFLTPAEKREWQSALSALKREHAFLFSFEAGVAGGERQVPVVLSPEMEGISPSCFSEIELLSLKTSDSSLPDHRAVLGSLMGLGIQRETVGEIFPYLQETVVAVKSSVAPFILSSLSRVGALPVTVKGDFSLPSEFALVYKTEPLTFSVASLRLDCVISALCHLSREEGTNAVKKGIAKVNFEEVLKPGRLLAPGDLLSVRGKGRFLLAPETGTTRSGRLHVTLLHYL